MQVIDVFIANIDNDLKVAIRSPDTLIVARLRRRHCGDKRQWAPDDRLRSRSRRNPVACESSGVWGHNCRSWARALRGCGTGNRERSHSLGPSATCGSDRIKGMDARSTVADARRR